MPTEDLFGLSNLEFQRNETKMLPNGRKSNLFHFKYTGEILEICPVCGAKLYRHGSRTIEITDTPFGGFPTNLEIEYQRKRCQECKNMWQPSFDFIDEKHKMTKRALADISEHAMRNTFADVSKDYVLSENTVKNVFVDVVNQYKENLRFKTPAFIGMDEIKIKGRFISVITDLEHRTMFDMLKQRNQEYLMDYFSQLPDREKILWVCTDMYRPFQKAIASYMPNAKWAIDHFHVVMKANESVDIIRKEVQADMTKADRVYTKRVTAYTLKKRFKDLNTEDAEAIKNLRHNEKLAPMAIAFDLKEDFFNIYDENPYSKENAQDAFRKWEESIPKDSIYDSFRKLANTVHNFYEQIFNYWDCPIAISNGFTECSNRLICETNLRGRGYSFDILRARTLYRNANMHLLIENGMIIEGFGPIIQESKENFRIEGSPEDDYDDDEFDFPTSEPIIDEETGELIRP